jgi:hypothetical protein
MSNHSDKPLANKRADSKWEASSSVAVVLHINFERKVIGLWIKLGKLLQKYCSEAETVLNGGSWFSA